MIPIIFQNDDFVVIDKPAGLSFHSENHAGVIALLSQQLAKQNGQINLFPVHRLDKMTSGLLIVALNKPTAQAFQALFSDRKLEKFYLAISTKKPKKKQGWIKGDMLPARNGSWKLTNTRNNPALTQFKSVSIQPHERLFLLKPVTGKTHQLRVALKSLSAEICGDLRYAQKREAKIEQRGYLHAYAIRFTLFERSYEFLCKPTFGERFVTQACQSKIEEWNQPWSLF